MNPPTQSGFSGPALTRNFAEIRARRAHTTLRGQHRPAGRPQRIHDHRPRGPGGGARHRLRAGRVPAHADDPDLALVSIEPETGRIKAMVGDRNENSQFNLATQGRRQPGSSFKAFALIAALEQGIDPDTKYVSEKKDVRGRRRAWTNPSAGRYRTTTGSCAARSASKKRSGGRTTPCSPTWR